MPVIPLQELEQSSVIPLEDLETRDESVAEQLLSPFTGGREVQVPEQRPEGELGALGNIFTRPAAASRAAIREQPALGAAGPLAGLLGLSGIGGRKAQEAAVTGSLLPDQVETFQEEAIRKAQTSESVAENVARGFLPSAKGLAQDILTNPGDAALLMAGKVPIGRGVNLEQAIGGSRLGQNIGRFLNKERSFFRPGQPKLKSDMLRKVVDSPFEEAVKPSTAGRTTAPQRKKFKENIRESVGSVIDNKENLLLQDKDGNFVKKLPETLDEASQAISQTKKEIFNTWDTLQKEAGEKGAKVNLGEVSKVLDDFINDEAVKAVDPSVVKHAQAIKDRFLKTGEVTPKTVDQMISSFNAKLTAFNKNPNMADTSKHVVNNGVVIKLRQLLDEAVESAIGKEFQPLKNKYGALSSIEKDVTTAAARDAKSSFRKIANFMDAFSAGDIARGVVTLNAGAIAKGTAQLALKALFVRARNPNRSIKRMFEVSDKIMNPVNTVADVFLP